MADFDIESPVLPLKDGLQVNEILKNGNVEFEVIPNDEDDEEDAHGTSAEACFDFEAMKQQVNLNVIDIDNDEEGVEDGSPFDKYRRKMFKLTEDGKVKKFVVKEGNGPLVPEKCIVYMRYQAYVEYQELPFDSTLMQCEAKRDEPGSFNLAQGQLLPGLLIGVLSMRATEKAEFLIHPDLAYGRMGCPPRIPPEATVLFAVEVDYFVDCGDIHLNEDNLSMEERKQFQHVYKKAKGHYHLANDLFSRGNFTQAVNKYKVAINMLHNSRLASEEEEVERNRLLLKLYSNSCICYHKSKSFKRVCVTVADSMRVNEAETLKNFKIMYFWGYAKMMLCDYESASKYLCAAYKMQPRDTEIQKAMAMLQKKEQMAKRDEQLMCKRAFRFQPASTVKLTEVNEEEEEIRSRFKNELLEFKKNPERETLLLKEGYTRKEEEIWLEVAKSLGLYARAVNSNPRVIDIQKPK